MKNMLLIFIFTFILPSLVQAKLSSQRALDLIDKVVKVYESDKKAIEVLNDNKRILNPFLMEDEEYVFGVEGIWGQASHDGMIMIAGGLLKNDFFTDDTFVALLCHEVGHLLGGQPADKNNLSYEGQADYYAASICMKKFFTAYPEELARKDYLHEHYFRVCGKHYSEKDKKRTCIKTMQAGLNLGVASALSIGAILLPGPAVNDYDEAEVTNEDRTTAQCIVDTFEAGALCKFDISKKVDFKNNSINSIPSCMNRPKCWYKK